MSVPTPYLFYWSEKCQKVLNSGSVGSSQNVILLSQRIKGLSSEEYPNEFALVRLLWALLNLLIAKSMVYSLFINRVNSWSNFSSSQQYSLFFSQSEWPYIAYRFGDVNGSYLRKKCLIRSYWFSFHWLEKCRPIQKSIECIQRVKTVWTSLRQG